MNHRFDFLKLRRKQLGLSLRDAGQLAGISHSTVADTEKRDCDPLSSTVKALCKKAYGINPALIMEFNMTKDQFHRAVELEVGAAR